MSSNLNVANKDNPKIANAVLESLDAKTIRAYIDSLGNNNIQNIQVFSTVPSTNDYLLERESESNETVVCVAEQQTQGRGRYGHQWESPPATNLYMSMSWSLPGWEQKYETLCLWLLIALAGLLEKNGCEGIQLKWPNDICYQNKKLAGVLIERKAGTSGDKIIIGLGLNIAMSLRNDIDVNASWADLITINPKWSLSRNELVARIADNFSKTLSQIDKNELSDLNSAWCNYDMLANKEVNFIYKNEVTKGLVKGIDQFGKIIIDLDGSLEHIHSAYVSKIKLTGNSL